MFTPDKDKIPNFNREEYKNPAVGVGYKKSSNYIALLQNYFS